MRKLATAAGLAALLPALVLAGCQKQTALASEANAVYERGVEPKLPPASVTLDSVPEVAPPPEDAPIDGTPPVETAAPDAAAPAAADPSAGYAPKTSADTVTDYRPGVAGEVGALPPVSDAAGLARSFLQWNSRAQGSPGAMEAGAVQLGADEQQYKPSDAELVAAEAGDRLSAALTGADQATKDAVTAVLGPDPTVRGYKRFEYRHSDVMGSGRYFYASAPKSASVPN